MPDREELYVPATRELAEQRRKLASGPAQAFRAFSQAVFAEGAVPAKTKQLIAVALALVPVPLLHPGAHEGGPAAGGTPEEIMEAIWVAAEMRAGGAYAHSTLALDTIAREQPPPATDV